MKIKLLIALCITFFSSVSLAMDTGGYYKITKLWAWGSQGDNVVLVQLENVNSACPGGYWIRDSANAGAKNLLSLALSAFHAKTPVMIYADENTSWADLAAKTCELQLITLVG